MIQKHSQWGGGGVDQFKSKATFYPDIAFSFS